MSKDLRSVFFSRIPLGLSRYGIRGAVAIPTILRSPSSRYGMGGRHTGAPSSCSYALKIDFRSPKLLVANLNPITAKTSMQITAEKIPAF